MDFKRGILIGALLWVLIFFEVSVLMFGFGITSPMATLTHQVLIAVLVLFCAWLFFRKHKGKKDRMKAIDGIYLGLVFALVGLVLDAVVTVPLFVKSYSFFADPLLWLGYAEGIVLCGLYDAFKIKF